MYHRGFLVAFILIMTSSCSIDRGQAEGYYHPTKKQKKEILFQLARESGALIRENEVDNYLNDISIEVVIENDILKASFNILDKKIQYSEPIDSVKVDSIIYVGNETLHIKDGVLNGFSNVLGFEIELYKSQD